ncbi:hypothetical protein D3P08_24345 [Paenibacillus nanensis]|uniref:Uncharacterized protein n=1 Tax=Paenibacillus nanensis TaxID=393251 RepID=A0A3A1UW00_9BACL|nr:hypothetical protein [Paenibacillus nanensis]RIX48635.1 hypothetical protein D3P08_24345 [Paenibacillus nanensis]
MKIASSLPSPLPKLDMRRGDTEERTFRQGQLPVTRPVTDLLEISAEGRQLAEDAILHHEAYRYDSLPDKPNGAPDDYINPADLMKRFEPESHEKFQEAMNNNAAEGLSLLLKFARQIPKHPDWIETYRKERESSEP